MKRAFTLLAILLIFSSGALSGRKWTSGGEMIGTNLSFPKMGANAVEGQTTTTFGGWGFGESDRTGNGHGAYGFFSNGAQRNYFEVKNLSITPPFNFRAWIKLGSTSNIDISIVAISNFVDDDIEVIWTNTGKVCIGRVLTRLDSTSGVVTQGSWILLKIYSNWAVSGDTDIVTINGETLMRFPSHTAGAPTGVTVGAFPVATLPTNPGTQFSADDLAFNDASGSGETGAPDDSAFVMWLPAVSDTAIGGWLAGGGSASSLFEGVNNTPVLGASSETNSTSIKNSVSSTTDNYDAGVISYQSAGVPTSKSVRLAQAVLRHGEHASSGTELGGLQLLSNPQDAGETSFTFGGDAGAHVDDATTSALLWRTTYGAVVYAPVLTLSSRPQIRVGRRTANTNQVCVDLLGVLIEVGSAFSSQGKKFIVN